jgi:hypothetical protein
MGGDDDGGGSSGSSSIVSFGSFLLSVSFIVWRGKQGGQSLHVQFSCIDPKTEETLKICHFH